MRFRRWHSLIIFGVILALWMVQTKTIHQSWNESSRLATIQALVEHGTWRIDASPYGHQTGDKMLLDGHYYSEKPPLFAAIGAALYAPFYYVFGARLAPGGCRPGAICVYYWLTVLMVGLPSALMATLFFRLTLKQLGSIPWAVGLTLLLCFGTVVWPYSLVFNHHLPAAIALFISFYLLFQNSLPSSRRFPVDENEKGGPNPSGSQNLWKQPYQFLGAGLLAGTAVMLDLTALFLAFALFLIPVFCHRRYLWLFVGAALVPLTATIIFNYQITGSIWFAYFSPEGYIFPGSQWDTSVGGQHPPDNLLLYAFRSLIGDHGLLGYAPLLIFAMWGLIRAVRQPVRLISSLLLLGIAGHLLFVLTRTNHFGGDAYGWRFFIPFIPTLYFFTIFVIPTRFYRPGGLGVATLWSLAALVSVFSAYQGVRATWHQVTPPVFVAVQSDFPYLGLEANLQLPAYDPSRPDLDQAARNFEVPPIPHPLDVTVNDKLRLLGYDLPSRRTEAGERLPLTLIWQSLEVAQEEYFVFVHLLDESQDRQGGLDRPLQPGYPVAYWYPGQVVTDSYRVPVEPEAAAGLAWLRLGLYRQVDNQVEPLPLEVGEGTPVETSLALGPILIGSPPQVARREQIDPQTSLVRKFGQPPIILLDGYDLNQNNGTGQLTLYWESLAPTPIDYTTFVHVRNRAGAIVAQKDGPTGGGRYPSSFWVPGEVIVDEIVLPVQSLPDSEYSLVIGLYNPVTGERLPVTGSPANEIRLDEIRLGSE